MVAFKGKLSEFVLRQHTISMEQAKRLKVQVQDVREEKMTILALVSATPLESNVDMVLVRVDQLSYRFICPCLWTKETGRILLSCTCSNLLHNISLDKTNFK